MFSDEQFQKKIDSIFGKEIPRIVGEFICVYSNFEWNIMMLTRYLLGDGGKTRWFIFS